MKKFVSLFLVIVMISMIFNLAGCKGSKTEGENKSKVSFTAWECADQPDALGNEDSFADGNWDANQIIEKLYEPLRAAYPEYITRENIGKDQSGEYEMWEYVFTPESYTQTIYIQSGVHSREKAALLGLARFLELLCKEWENDKDLEYIYKNVRLVVVPIVNPWGISQPNPDLFPTADARDGNSNEINLNRDFSSSSPQQETANVKAVLEKYKDSLSCAIDYHTTVSDSYGDYSIRWNSENQPNIELNNKIVNYLAEKNVKDRQPDLHYHTISTTSGTALSYFWNELNVVGATVEHADFVWDKNSRYSAVAITRSVELIGNVIINYAKQNY